LSNLLVSLLLSLLADVDDLEGGDDEGLDHLLRLGLVLDDDGVEVLAEAKLELVLVNITLDLDVCWEKASVGNSMAETNRTTIKE